MSSGGAAVLSGLFARPRRDGGGNTTTMTDLERQATDGTMEGGDGLETQSPTSRRSRFSTIPSRIQTFNFREWQNERRERQQRERLEVERLVREINQARRANMNRNIVPLRSGGDFVAGGGVNLDGRQTTGTGDLEAGNVGVTSADAPTTLSMRKITGKSRREREEGATLFGPNLANYFGSGSSTSGAIAGASLGQNSNSSATAIATALNGVNGGDNITPQSTLRRPRLGSRGRARGASLSGLSQYSLQNAEGIESVLSLTSPTKIDSSAVDSDANEMPMAEGIELETLRKWIERSTVGGTVEVNNAQEAAELRGSPYNPNALCTTLQSYVNLKRNTVKLIALPEQTQASTLKTLNDPLQPVQHPLATHSIQFEYDCAAPLASVQVFVRASRKHGSWVTWTTAREQAGLPIDLTIGAEDDGESKFLGQRGPPPHILGWPVYVSRTRKGFSVPLSAQVALRLEYYAPPKVTESTTSKVNPNASVVPETPGIDVSRRIDEPPETPAVTTSFDPLSLIRSNETGQLPSALPGVAAAVADNLQSTANANEVGGEETKEEKAARERAERETLKIAVVVEALDEDGKPLREPNLQTTYLRIASLPVRNVGGQVEIVDNEQSARDALEGGEIHDIALPVLEDDHLETTNELPAPPSSATTPSPISKRAWSLQIEGQEAEIGPHRFQLQELYGLSSRPPPPQQQQQHNHNETTEGGEEGLDENGVTADTVLPQIDLTDGNASECLICLSAPPTTLLLPCTHGLCLDCAVQLRDTVKATRESERRRGRRPKRKYACPVCRRVYSSMLHLSAVDEKSLAQSTAAAAAAAT